MGSTFEGSCWPHWATLDTHDLLKTSQSMKESIHSSRPLSSSPSDKTVWIKLTPIAAIQADPHHSFPPEVASSSWPLVVLSRTHFFIPALWLLLLIKKKKKEAVSV